MKEENTIVFEELEADIKKNTREVIRIKPEHYCGRNLIDIRVYFEHEEGGFRPTKKGVAFSIELLPQVIERLKKVHSDIQKTSLDG